MEVSGLGLENLSAQLFNSSKVKVTICNSIECEYELFGNDNHTLSVSREKGGTEELLVYFPTVNINFDPYINQYIGVVFDLFKLCDNVHFVISSFSQFLSTPIDSEKEFIFLRNWMSRGCEEDSIEAVEFSDRFSVDNCKNFSESLGHYAKHVIYSSKKVAFVAINDPIVAMTIDVLTVRHKYQLEKPLFIHLNQEFPWQQSPEDIQKEIFAYQQAYKVYRTVYYDAFESYSSYIPVRSGALVASYYVTDVVRTVKQYHSPNALANVLKASERPVLCSFAGGLKYSTLGGKVRQDRVEMVAAFTNFTHCDLFASDDAKVHALTKFEYIDLMRGTLFVLCPTGLNPETQRPHQALELGAIPLSLRVSEPYLDYLSRE